MRPARFLLASILIAGAATAGLGCDDPTHADQLCTRFQSECVGQDDSLGFCAYVDAVEHDASGGDCQDELDAYFACGDALQPVCDLVTACDEEGDAMFACLALQSG